MQNTLRCLELIIMGSLSHQVVQRALRAQYQQKLNFDAKQVDKTSDSLFFHGGNLTLINLFDTKI